jgi:glycogen debranching enzyme
MMAGLVSDDRAKRFVAHLDNEKEFKRPFRIPTLSADHPEYQERGDYWRGSVWAPTNYMVLEALDKYGYNDLAYDIACNYLENVVKVFVKDGTIYENYAPEYIERGSHSEGEFVGWTGLAPINIMFEYVFGIRPDAQNKKIVWYINKLEKHGVKNYPLGDKLIDIICEKRNSADETPVITVTGAEDITIEIVWNGKRITV